MTTPLNHPLIEENLLMKNALVVDDGPVERLAGKSMLEKLGFSVTVAASGEEAMRLLSERPIDLVLCDISMPGMGGLALLETIRVHPRPPIFILSASADDTERAAAALARGAFSYLTKPLRFEHVRDAVADALVKYKEERNAAQLASEASKQDALTSLINKDEFARRLAERLALIPAGNECGALMLIKVNGLNHINHSFGRVEGNKLLQLAAGALSRQVRPSDLLARFSGDMFSIYIDDILHDKIEERTIGIAEGVENVKIVLSGEAFALNLMIGSACVYANMEVEDLLNRADFALHLARERSRNRVHLYSEADEVHKRELSHQLNLLALVRAALEDNSRMSMFYQPIITLATGQLSHFEALLRLMDENGRPCNTGELVKICEVFGLIGRLDRAVVETCLRDVHKLPDGTGVAINLSGKSIGDPELLQFIEARIATLKIAPSRIIFELTETAAFHNIEEVRHFVKRIKELGCRFALDDFGVGFSSFYYIKELDFDYLKLDGSFIAHLPRNPNDQVFVRAMVEISRVFGLTVIAEWVEDQETAKLLEEFSVSLGQGYYFGKPMPLSQSQSQSQPRNYLH